MSADTSGSAGSGKKDDRIPTKLNIGFKTGLLSGGKE